FVDLLFGHRHRRTVPVRLTAAPESGWQRPLHSVVGSLMAAARRAAVISSPVSGVSAVTAEGVLCAFCGVLDPLSEHCLRRRAGVSLLVGAVFKTNRRLRERYSATCLRRRRPGQARRRQGGLQITGVRRCYQRGAI